MNILLLKLNILVLRSEKNIMPLNTDNCQVISFRHIKSLIIFNYQINVYPYFLPTRHKLIDMMFVINI